MYSNEKARNRRCVSGYVSESRGEWVTDGRTSPSAAFPPGHPALGTIVGSSPLSLLTSRLPSQPPSDVGGGDGFNTFDNDLFEVIRLLFPSQTSFQRFPQSLAALFRVCGRLSRRSRASRK
eukprot:Hpha_TRINITY_DN16945_c4_g1::TRINITY_DN16945_c4_g1_i5::g.54682::m.54682